jgi:hypothetical protein
LAGAFQLMFSEMLFQSRNFFLMLRHGTNLTPIEKCH